MSTVHKLRLYALVAFAMPKLTIPFIYVPIEPKMCFRSKTRILIKMSIICKSYSFASRFIIKKLDQSDDV